MEEGWLTVVIPTLNEKEGLAVLLRDLGRHEGVHVVVADGGSGDGTVELARSLGVQAVSVGKGRARQMNAGAACARGRALLFLHADTRLPRRFDLLLHRALTAGAAGGAFGFSVDGDSLFLRFITRTANFRSRRLGIVFGDQGIFARSETFREVGGFPDQPVMEDYELVRRLRKAGKFTVLEETVVTSARRWEEVGPLRNSMVNVVITWAYVLGVKPQRLARWHRGMISGGKRG